MFEVDNEFKNANVPRTIRFTETLFDELNKINSISNNHRYYDKANEWAEKYIADYNLPRF